MRWWRALPLSGLKVPKYFLSVRGSGYSVVLGSYRIGFGQRLTLDNTIATS